MCACLSWLALPHPFLHLREELPLHGMVSTICLVLVAGTRGRCPEKLPWHCTHATATLSERQGAAVRHAQRGEGGVGNWSDFLNIPVFVSKANLTVLVFAVPTVQKILETATMGLNHHSRATWRVVLLALPLGKQVTSSHRHLRIRRHCSKYPMCGGFGGFEFNVAHAGL